MGTITAITTTTMITTMITTTTTIMIIITIILIPIIMTSRVMRCHALPGRATLLSFVQPAGCPAT
jgi:hypothetical protein